MLGNSDDPGLAAVHPELRVILKKLSKRDATTRIRALDEFLAFVAAHPSADLATLVPVWPLFYCKLIIDADRRVRESTASLHSALVKILQKQIAPVLKSIAGPWLLSHFDPSKDVARNASDSFETTFPNKRADAISFCQQSLIAYVSSNILEQTPETLSDPRFTTPEDMLSKYVRVIAGSLDIVGHMIGTFSAYITRYRQY
eukprot:jgi/Hompol1/4408/HPOL_007088-RA